jgi:hypothetical protein
MTTAPVAMPHIRLLDEPGEGWLVWHLRDHDELLLNVGDLGLADTDDPVVRDAIAALGSLLILTIRERRGIDDQGLSGVAAKFVRQLRRGRAADEAARRLIVALGMRA